MKQTLLNIFKYCWLAAVMIFILLFVQQKWTMVSQALIRLPWPHIAMAFITLIIAKLILTVYMQYTLHIIRKPLPLPTCYRILPCYPTGQVPAR